MWWPDLIDLRRAVLPALEALEDEGAVPKAKYSFKIHDGEFAGVWVATEPSKARERLRQMENIYPNNAAACKYREREDGARVYEHGSYAYRPEGLCGKWQYHIRLLPHERGTALFVHYELNPLHSPIKHYRGGHWRVEPAKKWAREELPVDADASLDGIVFP